MKVLVTIASYGNGNDPYLERVIEEYRSMPHEVDIVVLSNIAKEMPSGIELVVGMPTSDPWSLPFAHKQVLADRADRYDLFIYSENDILITKQNIDAFLWARDVLPENEIAGFLRTEIGPDGHKYYPDVNKLYHWDPQSVVQREGHLFACFSCEHAGCYLLSRRQLQGAIASGQFLVAPHEGKFDLACTAATDPYTQCGFRKMICISDLDKFLVPHLSNKYVGTKYDLHESEFDRQLRAVLEIGEGKRSPAQLLEPETPFTRLRWFKDYYEPQRAEILDLIPSRSKNVLSIGCGWGAMEECLVQKNVRVVGIPLDSVIAACAEARGVENVSPDFKAAWEELAEERFDCILISNILHLIPDSFEILRECTRLLLPGGSIVVITPNFHYLKVLWNRVRNLPGYRNLGDYGAGGVNPMTLGLIRKWFTDSGLSMDQVIEVVPERAAQFARLRRVAGPYLASELIVVGRKGENTHRPVKSQYAETRRQPEKQGAVTV
jgi:2-polyprenyl-3-methyl-5-hydroxy-6-metoxy-1,4-benzoquinol methylase